MHRQPKLSVCILQCVHTRDVLQRLTQQICFFFNPCKMAFFFFYLLLTSSFFHFCMPLTTVIACWALCAAKMWINLPLKTVSELILCSQRTETAALLMCCSHCASCVDAILTPIYTIAVTEGAEEAAGCRSFSVEGGCTGSQCQGWGDGKWQKRFDFKCSNISHVGCNN